MLFKPAAAWRVRSAEYTDTPVPPDEPMGENPPDGAIIDYDLASNAQDVTLEVLDRDGKVLRSYLEQRSGDADSRADEDEPDSALLAAAARPVAGDRWHASMGLGFALDHAHGNPL